MDSESGYDAVSGYITPESEIKHLRALIYIKDNGLAAKDLEIERLKAARLDGPEVEIPDYGEGNIPGSCPCHCDDEHYDACSEDCPWYSDTTGDIECLLNDEVTQGAASARCPGPGAYVLLEKVQP